MSVITRPRGVLEYRRDGVVPRAHALLRAGALDRALGAGASPEASLLLAVHARRIVGPRACRALATSLRRLIAGHAPRNSIPVSRTRIRSAATALSATATRLETSGPIAARGVAALRLLLGDGAGPLYCTGPDIDLAAELTRILTDMEPA
jgi:hypothetical protein